jgi:Leucine-rich repeat (LRR) protein
VFNASGCKFTNDALTHLSTYRHLRTLDLSFCDHLDSRFLYHLTTLIHLTVLNLKGLIIGPRDDEKPIDILFQYCTNIKTLYLSNSKFTGRHTPNITRLSHLHTLDLVDSSLSDEGLEFISYLPSLTTFDFSHCPFVTDASFSHLTRLTRLKKLFFAQNPQITDWGVRFLSVLTDLTHISHAQAAVTDEGTHNSFSPSLCLCLCLCLCLWYVTSFQNTKQFEYFAVFLIPFIACICCE